MNYKSGCKCARFDFEEGYICKVTGDRCMFFTPSSEACADIFGEGPDVDNEKQGDEC